MLQRLPIVFTLTLLFPNYVMADMTQEQCEYCLTKAKKSVIDSNNDCQRYINRTDTSWIRKELYYGANCTTPNFYIYFAEAYPNWQQDCNQFYSGNLSYTRLIQNVWNDNIPKIMKRSKELCTKAQKQSRENPQLLQKEIEAYIQEQTSIGEYLEIKALKEADLRGDGDYTSTTMALNNFTKILSNYGLTRGKEYDFSLCRSANDETYSFWMCEALKNNLLITAVCHETTRNAGDIPTFSNCDLSYTIKKYSQIPVSDCQL